ncbi:hypothetical protein NHX12_001013, partial [Muraenolepis orangiensis]
QGHMPDKIVDFIGQECPAPPEAIVTSSDATRHHYALCATSANVVMKSYSCCDSPLLESDVGNSDEEFWAIGDTQGHMPDKIVDFIGRECPAPPEAIVTSSDATRHHYADYAI